MVEDKHESARGNEQNPERIEEILPKELPASVQATPQEEFFEKVLSINRTAKVTRGGKRLGFSALVVVGDRKGSVGFGFGKANEVSDAIRKGLNDARKSMFKITMRGATIPHEVIGHFGASDVLLKPAGEGTGVIAGSATRALCDAAGIKDILTKCFGSNNAFNVIKATVDGLKSLRDKNEVRDSKVNTTA